MSSLRKHLEGFLAKYFYISLHFITKIKKSLFPFQQGAKFVDSWEVAKSFFSPQFFFVLFGKKTVKIIFFFKNAKMN